MAGITWLHLSDWHQRSGTGQEGQAFDPRVVAERLYEDIRGRAAIDPSLAEIDFVVFSGDLAFRGKEEEYQAAKEGFLKPLLDAAGVGRDRFFVVPGNHDLDREMIPELPAVLQRPLESREQVQDRLVDAKKRARTLLPFEAYTAFVAEFNAQPDPEYASLCQWTIGDQPTALLGLNSAWMCGRQDEKGQVDDDGSVLVGEPQVVDGLSGIKDADLCIAVLHHPFDWLNRFERNDVERWLKSRFHFILYGHAHVPDVCRTSDTSGDYVTVPAGAIYDRRKSEEWRFVNAYNLVHLEGGRGTVFLRQWNDVRNEWMPHTVYPPNGVFTFQLPRGLSIGAGAAPAPRAGRRPRVTAAQRRQAAEEKYRRLLLESCDIITLANLPEQDRHLAQRELELRRLYVPLRAWLEVGARQEPAQAEEGEAVWDSLERRRAPAWSGGFGDKAEPRERERVAVGERLKAAQRLVVLGDPGAGKTVLTRWIATAYLLRLKQDPDWAALPDVQTLPEADWLPILVRCRELPSHCVRGALDDVLGYTLRKAELSEEEAADLKALLRKRLEAGQAILLLDGLDEISDPQDRACFCQQVEQMASAFPQAPIVATSRIVGYREMGRIIGRGFEHLTLADLTREEKDDFSHRWCQLTELPERREAATQELIHDIHSADRIERLTGNPMLLTTMALVKRKVGKLPSRRADLYYEAVQVLLNWRREVDEPLDWREAIPQLEYLAYAMCNEEVHQLSQDEVIKLFSRMRAEYPQVHAAQNRAPEEFLQRLEARTGILVEAGRVRHLGMPTPVYEFRHLTFQEYLAARALVYGRFPGRDPGQSLADQIAPLAGRTAEVALLEYGPSEPAVVENWREALRLCLAICPDDDVDPALRAVLTPLPGEPPGTARARAIQAALCLADEPNAGDAAAEVLRAFAAQVGEYDGGGYLLTGLDAAALELAATRWAPTLRRALLHECYLRTPEKRESPAGLLGMVGAAGLPQDPVRVAEWLGKQTGRLRGGEQVEAVDAALCVMQAAFERRAVLVPGLVDALLDRLSSSPPMAFAAAWALAWLNAAPMETKWHPTEPETDALLSFLSDPQSDPYGARYLSWIMGNERVERAVQPLLFWLGSPVAYVRRAAARALGRIKSEQAVAPLIQRLEDADDRVRSAAAEALGRIKSEAAVDPLIRRLEDADATVRRAALGGLAQGLDETGRRLLSRDLDGVGPFLDPQAPIDEEQVQRAARRLELSADEVRGRYEALAERFGLRLAWRPRENALE